MGVELHHPPRQVEPFEAIDGKREVLAADDLGAAGLAFVKGKPRALL
jgi:hypothetical protein